MLQNIATKKKSVNNKGRVADSSFLSAGKQYYYKLLIKLYGYMGNKVDFCWANSTWTCNHMRQLWAKFGEKTKNPIMPLYPPCNIKKFSKVGDANRENILVSFAQFR